MYVECTFINETQSPSRNYHYYQNFPSSSSPVSRVQTSSYQEAHRLPVGFHAGGTPSQQSVSRDYQWGSMLGGPRVNNQYRKTTSGVPCWGDPELTISKDYQWVSIDYQYQETTSGVPCWGDPESTITADQYQEDIDSTQDERTICMELSGVNVQT
ncbi:10763_t:CDS:2, partial [Paraglomus occultum]